MLKMRNYFSLNYLKSIGVKMHGDNIKISKLARIYNPSSLVLHDNIRIDDFTILSGRGNIEIGNYVHVGSQCSISSHSAIKLCDYTGISSGVKLFGGSDDFSGKFMTGPLVPSKFIRITHGDIILNKHVIVSPMRRAWFYPTMLCLLSNIALVNCTQTQPTMQQMTTHTDLPFFYSFFPNSNTATTVLCQS